MRSLALIAILFLGLSFAIKLEDTITNFSDKYESKIFGSIYNSSTIVSDDHKLNFHYELIKYYHNFIEQWVVSARLHVKTLQNCTGLKLNGFIRLFNQLKTNESSTLWFRTINVSRSDRVGEEYTRDAIIATEAMLGADRGFIKDDTMHLLLQLNNE